MPRLMYIQCNFTQNGLHKAIRLSYPTLLLWVAVLNTNMVKIKYARPKILAGHSLGITALHERDVLQYKLTPVAHFVICVVSRPFVGKGD